MLVGQRRRWRLVMVLELLLGLVVWVRALLAAAMGRQLLLQCSMPCASEPHTEAARATPAAPHATAAAVRPDVAAGPTTVVLLMQGRRRRRGRGWG